MRFPSSSGVYQVDCSAGTIRSRSTTSRTHCLATTTSPSPRSATPPCAALFCGMEYRRLQSRLGSAVVPLVWKAASRGRRTPPRERRSAPSIPWRDHRQLGHGRLAINFCCARKWRGPRPAQRRQHRDHGRPASQAVSETATGLFTGAAVLKLPPDRASLEFSAARFLVGKFVPPPTTGSWVKRQRPVPAGFRGLPGKAPDNSRIDYRQAGSAVGPFATFHLGFLKNASRWGPAVRTSNDIGSDVNVGNSISASTRSGQLMFSQDDCEPVAASTRCSRQDGSWYGQRADQEARRRRRLVTALSGDRRFTCLSAFGAPPASSTAALIMLFALRRLHDWQVSIWRYS